jgi:hypothetical protein
MPRSGFPCPNAVVHFTGVTNSSVPCSYDVIYATVDRVALEGPKQYHIPPWEPTTGILVSPGDSDDPGCHNGLVGTFKINRSLIAGYHWGAKINMFGGGAQIGVYKSTFDGNHIGLYIEDSDAMVTVSENHFASRFAASINFCHTAATGIVVLAASKNFSRGVTRLDVHGNTFDVRAGWPCYAVGLWIDQRSSQTIRSPVISNNYFRLMRENLDFLIYSWGVSGGVLNANRIEVTGRPDQNPTVGIWNGADWTIVLNEGFEHTAEQIDIGLGTNTSNILIGPGQGATVEDKGNNNIVLPQ